LQRDIPIRKNSLAGKKGLEKVKKRFVDMGKKKDRRLSRPKRGNSDS